jgi:hypothetical protein
MNHSCGGEIGPVYKGTFKAQRGRGIESFLKGLFRFVKPLLYQEQRLLAKRT